MIKGILEDKCLSQYDPMNNETIQDRGKSYVLIVVMCACTQLQMSFAYILDFRIVLKTSEVDFNIIKNDI